MSEKGLPVLKIDQEFRALIRPLTQKEYNQLEKNLIRDGCINPIITWDGFIIDGHNRYSICTQNKIPFSVMEIEFSCREEAIAWICAQQLGRRNITEETRKFLIGMQYEAEKKARSRSNPVGNNQYLMKEGSQRKVDQSTDNEQTQKDMALSGHMTAQRIAEENHISWNTVNKYAAYSRAIEEIRRKVPEAVPLILSSRLKISHENTVKLSQMSVVGIRNFIERLNRQSDGFVKYNKTRREIEANTEEDARVSSPSVKDMPLYDPDAEVTALSLTIPAWTGTLNKTSGQINLETVSPEAKRRLSSALEELIHIARDLEKNVREE